MDFRKGTCNDCGAAFKVPASFPHSRAKCKSCGGVVEIGEVQSAGGAPGAKPIPAKKIAPAAEPSTPSEEPAASSEPEEVKPSGRKRSGPSMKEKLLAQRQAAEAGTEAPAAKAAPAKRATTSRSSTRGSAGSSRAGASKASTGKREVHRSAHVGGKGDKHQEKSPLPVIVGIVVVLLMIVGGFLFKDTLFGSDDPANASESTASNEGEGAESATESEADASSDASTENAGDDGEDAADAGDEVATDDEEPPAEEDDGPPRGHPDSVDLSQLPDIEPFGDTTDEEWTQMNEWMTTFINDSSARGNRAGNSLKAMHRKALPVIMNQFKTLDFGEQEDVNTGDVVQRMLTEICGGKNYTWKYDTEDSSHFFNKRVVEMWQGLIVDQALASELAWAGILKVDISELPDPIGGADAADSTPGFTPPDFGGLDDIDD